MRITKKYLNELTYKVIGCAIEVHKILGPGLLESVYEKCFLRELALRGIAYKNQLWVPLNYKLPAWHFVILISWLLVRP